ncbi:hypothetical protein HK104_002211, partial [Borealophlyctis nickersoniae]
MATAGKKIDRREKAPRASLQSRTRRQTGTPEVGNQQDGDGTFGEGKLEAAQENLNKKRRSRRRRPTPRTAPGAQRHESKELSVQGSPGGAKESLPFSQRRPGQNRSAKRAHRGGHITYREENPKDKLSYDSPHPALSSQLAPDKEYTLPATGRKFRPPVARPQPKSLEARLQEAADPIDRAYCTRALELQQLERRFRPSGYREIAVNSFDTVVQLGIVPSDPDFPYDLESLRLQITIPSSYPITCSSILVLNKEIPTPLARRVEKSWDSKAGATKLPLLQMINWLDKNLEQLLMHAPEPEMKITFVSKSNVVGSAQSINNDGTGGTGRRDMSASDAAAVVNRISQNTVLASSVESDDGYDSHDMQECSDDDNDSDGGIGEGGEDCAHVHSQERPTGTEVRLVDVRLENISLLQSSSLHLMVRCERCKDTVDIPNLAPLGNARETERSITCARCNSELAVRYREDFVHPTKSSIGYLDCGN